MAERRMFAKTIIDSDAFLDMPLSAQALYFHLSMRADDEGFINNPKKIQRMIGASDDDAKLLIAKNFIIPFESGVVVIKHWKIHNYIRNDRLVATKYQDEKLQLTVKDNGAYTQVENCEERPKIALCQSSDRQVTDIRPSNVSIGKDSIGKDSIDKNKSIYMSEFEELWTNYPKKHGKQKALQSYIKARKEGTTFEEVEQGILAYLNYIRVNKVDMQFVKMGSTFFNQRAWQDDWSIISVGNGARSRRELLAELIRKHEDEL